MILTLTFGISCLLLLVAFGFGALLGYNLIEGANTRRKPKLYEYRYKPVNLPLSEAEVRARIRDLANDKEATSVRALMKGRASKPVQRVTAGLGPQLDPERPTPIAFTAVPETTKTVPDQGAPAPQPQTPEAKVSADVIDLGQRRPGLVFYRIDEKGNEGAGRIAVEDRPPLSVLATMAPEAVVASVVQVGNGHEPFRLERPDGAVDELSLISGVSEAQERALNRLGIYHFWQVGSWTPEHVAWIASRLPEGERIARENWMAQAVKLMNTPRRVFNIEDTLPPKKP